MARHVHTLWLLVVVASVLGILAAVLVHLVDAPDVLAGVVLAAGQQRSLVDDELDDDDEPRGGRAA
jgi:hypothetical protein